MQLNKKDASASFFVSVLSANNHHPPRVGRRFAPACAERGGQEWAAQGHVHGAKKLYVAHPFQKKISFTRSSNKSDIHHFRVVIVSAGTSSVVPWRMNQVKLMGSRGLSWGIGLILQPVLVSNVFSSIEAIDLDSPKTDASPRLPVSRQPFKCCELPRTRLRESLGQQVRQR